MKQILIDDKEAKRFVYLETIRVEKMRAIYNVPVIFLDLVEDCYRYIGSETTQN